jgi:glucokinase
MSDEHAPRASTPPLLLGIDIGGTKCAAVVSRDGGRTVHAKARFATAEEDGPSGVLGRLADEAAALLVGEAPAAVGVSCGGPLDSRAGLVLSPPNLPGWDRVPVTDFFRERFPGAQAYLMNDANACAVAEWRFGAAKGCETAVFLTFGTGMGAGLIVGGRLHEGRDDLAGEVGHLRLAEDGPEGHGKRGSFEGFCSGGGIARLARGRVRDAWARGETVPWCPDEVALASLDAAALARAASDDDPLARGVFDTSAFYLGRGLALLIDLLNPEAVVIGSVYARAEHLLRETALRVIAEEALPAAAARCRVVPAELGEALGDIAALSVARYGLEADGLWAGGWT